MKFFVLGPVTPFFCDTVTEKFLQHFKIVIGNNVPSLEEISQDGAEKINLYQNMSLMHFFKRETGFWWLWGR